MSDSNELESMASEIRSVEPIRFSSKKEFVTRLAYEGCLKMFENSGIESLTSTPTDRFTKIVRLVSGAADELEKTENQTWTVQPKPET